MFPFLKEKSHLYINAMNYFGEKNPFMLLSYNQWVDRNKIIRKNIFQKLEYKYCQCNLHTGGETYSSNLNKCNNNIEDSCSCFLDFDFTPLHKGTVSHEKFMQFMYVNYLYGCYIYYNEPKSYTVREMMEYFGNRVDPYFINANIFYPNYYYSAYSLNLLLDNISKYPIVKEFNLSLDEIEFYCGREDLSIRILMEPIACFSCFRGIHEGLMKIIEERIINIIDKDYKVIRATRLKEYIVKKKELNRKKPKRTKRKGYILLKKLGR